MTELFLLGMICVATFLRLKEEEDFLKEEDQLHHLRVKLT